MKTYVYKLYHSEKTEHIDQVLDVSAWAYNHCIALHRRYYKLSGKMLSKYTLQKHLTKLKKQSKYASWKIIPSQALQDITDRIDRAYKLFFSNLKAKKKCSPPHFQKRKKYNSFTLKQAGYEFLDDSNKVRIGNKVFSYCKSRSFNGNIKTVTIKRKNNGYYIFVVVEQKIELPKPVTSGKSVGFDFGMDVFLTASDGDHVRFESPFLKNLSRLKRLSRKVSKSKGRRGSKRSLAKLHERVSNQRKSYHWQLAHHLCTKYDYMFFETLDLKSMLRSVQRKLHDYGFAYFLEILRYVASLKGKVVHCIDKWYPSSQICSDCDVRKTDLKLSDREHICYSCGTVKPRDLNAAINIEREGASSLGLYHDVHMHLVA